MLSIFASFNKLNQWQRIMLALISGTLLGLVLGPKAVYIRPVGALFINAINMMVAPVVFTAIVCSVISIQDPQRMRRLGAKTLILYTISMAVAAMIGIGMAMLIAPGQGFHLNLGEVAVTQQQVPSMVDMFINIIPANPIKALANGNILQIVVFAVILGIAINMAGAAAQPVVQLFQAISAVVFKLTGLVMRFAPIGIFALMAWVSGEFGLEALIPLLKLVLTVYLACILHCIVYYGGALYLARLNPLAFFRAIASAMLLAFSSSSSAATLPVTMKCAEENLGISKEVARFLLPLGTSLNLNGLSIYLSVATIFAANIYGVHLSAIQYLTIVLSIILTSMGAGGIPGTGIIVMSAVMSSIGLPLGAIPLIAGVDRLNDMAQTTTNVIGDLFAAAIVAKHEGELDSKRYDAAKPEGRRIAAHEH